MLMLFHFCQQGTDGGSANDAQVIARGYGATTAALADAMKRGAPPNEIAAAEKEAAGYIARMKPLEKYDPPYS